MDGPVVSVIIPAYNCAATISQTIQSVLDQTYKRIEVLVVDDESQDRTLDEVAHFHDPRVVYLWQAHAERSNARNYGIRQSKGDYLAFVDADDWWLPEKLEKEVALLGARQGLGLVFCDVYYTDQQSHQILWRFGDRVKMHRGKVWRYLCETNFIQSPTPVIPKGIFDHIGCFDPELTPLEDWDMWLRIAANYPVDFVLEPLAFYRYSGKSTSLAHPTEQVYKSHLKLLNKLESQYLNDGKKSLCKLNKHRAIVHYTYGVQQQNHGDHKEALTSFAEARGLNPTYLPTYVRLAESYARLLLTGNGR